MKSSDDKESGASGAAVGGGGGRGDNSDITGADSTYIGGGAGGTSDIGDATVVSGDGGIGGDADSIGAEGRDGVNWSRRELDNKWFGVPPKGERPIPGKWRYVGEIFAVIMLEFALWAAYRYFSAPLLGSFGTFQFYAVHIVAAPTIHLLPIIAYWKYVRKEPGVPFKFTRKLLMSGVMVGLVGAIIWRVMEMLTYDALAVMAGGYAPDTLMFFNWLDYTTAGLFALMTFTHFFIVGPVEELEFRGFVQDQGARAIPNWQALTLSSVLFGCSHIPIALFVYQFPPATFAVALVGWISAGFVFGALYTWSRNIWACIVMHGMGNWQLSVYMFSSAQILGGMDSLTEVTVGTVSSLIVNSLMIGIFYLVHKYYWQPHRRGELAFNGAFSKLQNKIYEHDFRKKPLRSTSMGLVVFCVVVCGMIMAATYSVGETDIMKLYAFPDLTLDRSGDYSYEPEESAPLSGQGFLAEGESETISIDREGVSINSIRVTVTWQDEDDIRRVRLYENSPDTFSVKVTAGGESSMGQGTNPEGGEGSASAELEVPQEDGEPVINATVTITMEEAGNYYARAGIGALALVDDGNDYEYEIVVD